MVEKMKAKIAYTVREVTAPGETQPSTVPMIIDRSTTLPLAKLIANAIDRGLVAGLLRMKPDDLRIPQSFEMARAVGLEYSFDAE